MEEIGDKLIPWIGKTAKQMGIVMTEKFQQHELDLTKMQWLLLKQLCETDGQLQKELAFITDRDKTSLGRLVATMERKGLINRIPMEADKRAKQIFLTEKGKATYLKSIPAVRELVMELQDGIEQEKLEMVIEVLKKIQHNIKNMNSRDPLDSESYCL